jgi:hypothetical protein
MPGLVAPVPRTLLMDAAAHARPAAGSHAGMGRQTGPADAGLQRTCRINAAGPDVGTAVGTAVGRASRLLRLLRRRRMRSRLRWCFCRRGLAPGRRSARRFTLAASSQDDQPWNPFRTRPDHRILARARPMLSPESSMRCALGAKRSGMASA